MYRISGEGLIYILKINSPIDKYVYQIFFVTNENINVWERAFELKRVQRTFKRKNS